MISCIFVDVLLFNIVIVTHCLLTVHLSLHTHSLTGLAKFHVASLLYCHDFWGWNQLFRSYNCHLASADLYKMCLWWWHNHSLLIWDICEFLCYCVFYILLSNIKLNVIFFLQFFIRFWSFYVIYYFWYIYDSSNCIINNG